MDEKHCKDVTEDLFKKDDYHHLSQDEPPLLEGMENLDAQQLREKKRLRKYPALDEEPEN